MWHIYENLEAMYGFLMNPKIDQNSIRNPRKWYLSDLWTDPNQSVIMMQKREILKYQGILPLMKMRSLEN